MSNHQGQPSQPNELSPALNAAVAPQHGTFNQLASQMQAQINPGVPGPVLMQSLQQTQEQQRVSLGMGQNGLMSPFLAPPSNMMAAVQQQQQQQQLMPMMWQQLPEAGPPNSFPMPMAQLSTSNMAPPPQPITEAVAATTAPVPVPVSEPSSVSTKNNNPKKPAAAKRKAKTSAAKSTKATTTNDMDSLDDEDAKVIQSRERNREHARSTRLRKKAYIQKLKDMAQGLRQVQTEEIRQRRISMQKLLDVQKVRRAVVQSVLQYHASYEQDPAKWNVLLEESFFLKQPVTPFRSFRRSEVERDYRVIRGTEAVIADAASLAVMLERVGSHTKRWQRIKRSEFVDEDILNKEITAGRAPESSLSSASSTDSSNGGAGSRSRKSKRGAKSNVAGALTINPADSQSKTPAVSSSDSGKENTKRETRKRGTASQQPTSSSDEAAEQTSSSAKRQRGSPPQIQTTLSQSSGVVAASVASASQPYPLKALSSYNLNLVSPKQRTSASYYMNEDDMIMIEDVMMCPYVFRTSHAVTCGALAEVIVPGMLRVQFSPNNKLLSMELVFDAMGFMQQLDGANGGNITAQVVPGSLEMALMHCAHEARVITQATPPYSILHVNEMWTNLTQHSQVEVEGKALLPLLEGAEVLDEDGNISCPEPGKVAKLSPLLDDAAAGRPTFSTAVHYRKSGKTFVDFMCSYPLTNSDDEITHLLHVNMELPKGETYIP